MWLTAWLGYSVILGIAYAWLPANPDQAIFDYAGWILCQGGRAYLDVAEQNFPGKMWLHALSTACFGNHFWSYRVFDYALMLFACSLLYRLLRRTSMGRYAWIVVPIYQSVYVTAGPWMVGTRDVLAAHCLLGAGLAHYLGSIRSPLRWNLLFGAASAVAILIRPTYALFPAVIVLEGVVACLSGTRSWLEVIRAALAGAFAALALLGAVAAMMAGTGQLQEWYRLAVEYNLEVYSHNLSIADQTRVIVGLLSSWHWYVAFAFCGAVMWLRSDADRGLLRVPVVIAIVVLVSAYAQLKGFGYHLGGLLPVMAMLIAYFVFAATRHLTATRTIARHVAVATLWSIVVIGLAKKQAGQLSPQYAHLLGRNSQEEMMAAGGYEDTFEVARLVRQTTTPDETVLVWSRKLHINFLSQRRSPTRFITVWILNRMPESFDVGQTWIDDFVQAWRARTPAAVVLDAEGAPGGIDVLGAQKPDRALDFLRSELTANYALEKKVGRLLVYRRIVGR